MIQRERRSNIKTRIFNLFISVVMERQKVKRSSPGTHSAYTTPVLLMSEPYARRRKYRNMDTDACTMYKENVRRWMNITVRSKKWFTVTPPAQKKNKKVSSKLIFEAGFSSLDSIEIDFGYEGNVLVAYAVSILFDFILSLSLSTF